MALCSLPYYSPFASVVSWNCSHLRLTSSLPVSGWRWPLAQQKHPASCTRNLLSLGCGSPHLNSSTYPNFPLQAASPLAVRKFFAKLLVRKGRQIFHHPNANVVQQRQHGSQEGKVQGVPVEHVPHFTFRKCRQGVEFPSVGAAELFENAESCSWGKPNQSQYSKHFPPKRLARNLPFVTKLKAC